MRIVEKASAKWITLGVLESMLIWVCADALNTVE